MLSFFADTKSHSICSVQKNTAGQHDAKINLAENGNVTTLSAKQLGHIY